MRRFNHGSKRVRRRVQVLTLLAVLCLLLTGCFGSEQSVSKGVGQPRQQTDQSGKTDAGEGSQSRPIAAVPVYYVKVTDTDIYLVREVHQISTSGDLKVAALQELVSGTPTTPGAKVILPPGTKIRSVRVNGGLATVDFNQEVLKTNVGSSGEAMGIKSIVNTLTEFPGINRVSFTVDGGLSERAKEWWGHVGLFEQPFSRDLNAVQEPAIWIDSPVAGASVASPVTVTGTARVFEAAFTLRLVDKNGQQLAQTHPVADQGAPNRGTFKATLAFKLSGAQEGYLEAFWNSPKDGSVQDLVRVPVRFK